MEAHKPTARSHALYDREALASEVHKRQREAWLAENREAIDAYNELVARDGVFSTGLRGF